MLRYYSYLMKILVRKITFPIIIMTYCLFSSIYFVLNFYLSNATSQTLLPITSRTGYLAFAFGTIFTSFGVVRIFKTGDKNGTELLILAKPILRSQIIIVKFLTILSLVLIFNVCLFIFNLGITQLETNATNYERFAYSLTMALGNAIVSTIMAAIIVFLSSMLGKKAVIAIGNFFSTTIILASTFIISFSNAISPLPNNTGSKQGTYLKKLANKNENLESLYKPKQDSRNYPSQSIFVYGDYDVDYPYTPSDLKLNQKSWYRTYKFFDFWYHWSRFYKLAEPRENEFAIDDNAIGINKQARQVDFDEISDSQIQSFISEAKKTAINQYFLDLETPLESKILTQKKLIMLFTKDEIDFEKNILPSIFNATRYKQLTNANGKLLTNLTTADEEVRNVLTAKQMQDFAKKIFSKSTSPFSSSTQARKYGLEKSRHLWENKIAKIMGKLFGIEKDISLKYYRILLWRAINDYQKNQLAKLRAGLKNNSITKIRASEILDEKINIFTKINVFAEEIFAFSNIYNIFYKSKLYSEQKPFNIFNENEKRELSVQELKKRYHFIANFKESEYLATNLVIIGWTSVGVILIILSTIIYFKKDFK